MISFLAFAIPLTLYTSLPSTFWNFDGVACAAALELGQPSYFFHSNHLLYGYLGFLFWRSVGLWMGIARALPALQLFTSLVSCAGLVGLYRILLPLLPQRWNSLLLTLCLAVTASFWVWSIESQVYALAFLSLAWATQMLLFSGSPHKDLWVGLLHGGAVLGHVMHVIWILPALYWMCGESKGIRRYLLTFALTTIVPYLLVIAWVIAPGHSWGKIAVWLKGSAALTPDRHWAWHFGGIQGPWIWFKSTAPVLWGSFWPYGTHAVSKGLWALCAVCISLTLILLGLSMKSPLRRLLHFSGIWLGVYGLFLSTWEPGTYCYRMTDIVPLGILLALGTSTLKYSRQTVLLAALLGSTLTLNLATLILPMHDPSQNAVYTDTLRLSKISPANSLYITEGGEPWLYLLYFTGRTAWNARRFEPNALAQEIYRQKHSRPVYVLKGTSWQKI